MLKYVILAKKETAMRKKLPLLCILLIALLVFAFFSCSENKVLICPSCKGESPPSAAFCSICGYSFAATTPTQSAAGSSVEPSPEESSLFSPEESKAVGESSGEPSDKPTTPAVSEDPTESIEIENPEVSDAAPTESATPDENPAESDAPEEKPVESDAPEENPAPEVTEAPTEEVFDPAKVWLKLSSDDGKLSTSYYYDAEGQLVCERAINVSNGKLNEFTEHIHDIHGNEIEIQYTRPAVHYAGEYNAYSKYEYTYEYDANGRIIMVSGTGYGGNSEITYTYGADGKIAEETHYHYGSIDYKIVYENGRIARVERPGYSYSEIGGKQYSVRYQEERYIYDDNGYLTSIVTYDILDLTFTEECPYGHALINATCEKAAFCETCDKEYGATVAHNYVYVRCGYPKACVWCQENSSVVTEHTWVEATCSNPKTCSTCKQSAGEALPHNLSRADCIHAATCYVCGFVSGDPLGHDWIEATCDQAAYCNRCKEVSGKNLAHDWIPPTCTEPATCKHCGETSGDSLTHDYSNRIYCTDPYICTRCGYEEIYWYSEHAWIPATCAAPMTCSYCGITEGEPSLWHTSEWGTMDSIEPSCGYPPICGTCNKPLYEPIDHSWIPATYDEPATCRYCGLTEGYPLDYEGHWEYESIYSCSQHDWQEATCDSPATCRNCGKTFGSKLYHDYVNKDCSKPSVCSRCGKQDHSYTRYHSWEYTDCTSPAVCAYCSKTATFTKGHVLSEATCDQPPICEDCGEAIGEALGHSWNEANCWSAKYCYECGKYEGYPLGHDWKNATCTEEEQCTRCQMTRGEPTGHTFPNKYACGQPIACLDCGYQDSWIQEHNWIDATCESPTTCQYCEETHGKPLGHKWSEGDCDDYVYCTVCGKEGNPPTGHRWRVQEGVECYVCNLCGLQEVNAINTTVFELDANGNPKTQTKVDALGNTVSIIRTTYISLQDYISLHKYEQHPQEKGQFPQKLGTATCPYCASFGENSCTGHSCKDCASTGIMKCHVCKGTGVDAWANDGKCFWCNGEKTEPCEGCGGKGRRIF